MGKVIDDEFAISRFYLTVFGAFATVAVSLALIGVYGVLSYSVARRMREIGLRLALGASTADAFRLVIWQGLRYVVVGATAGVVISLMLTRLIQGLLYGVEPADPLTLAAATLLLGAVAVIGCSIPAWRASRVDPTTALRAP